MPNSPDFDETILMLESRCLAWAAFIRPCYFCVILTRHRAPKPSGNSQKASAWPGFPDARWLPTGRPPRALEEGMWGRNLLKVSPQLARPPILGPTPRTRCGKGNPVLTKGTF